MAESNGKKEEEINKVKQEKLNVFITCLSSFAMQRTHMQTAYIFNILVFCVCFGFMFILEFILEPKTLI